MAKPAVAPIRPAPADMHIPDGEGKIVHAAQLLDDKAVGKKSLINDLDDGVILGIGPDGAKVRVFYLHILSAISLEKGAMFDRILYILKKSAEQIIGSKTHPDGSVNDQSRGTVAAFHNFFYE